MPKHALSFVELHNQLFMNGSNLGNKVNAAQRGAKLWQDDERGVVWVHFKDRVTAIPLASVASSDFIEIPEDIKELLGITQEVQPKGPPSVRAKKVEVIELPAYDPNDHSAEAHRARVRAASANSNRAQPIVQNDFLIQEARNHAAGQKSKAQVSNPTMPKEGVSVSPKPKAISHAQLKAQVAAEAKEQ